jgi:DNA-binding NtrC family response regulator
LIQVSDAAVADAELQQHHGQVATTHDPVTVQVAERSGKPTLELSERAAERLMAYEWPGNVRELENCIEHAVALARFDQVTVEDLPEKLRAAIGEARPLVTIAGDAQSDLQRLVDVIAALKQAGVQAAAIIARQR